MANTVEYELESMELIDDEVEDALLAVIQTILFNRALGVVTPKSRTLKSIPGIIYPYLDDADVDKILEEEISKLRTDLCQVGPGLHRGEMTLSFYERVKSDGFLGIKSESKVYWESWRIPIIINSGGLRSQSSQLSVQSNLFRIIQFVTKSTYIPKFVPSNKSVVYDFELASKQNQSPGMMKQLISHGNSFKFEL